MSKPDKRPREPKVVRCPNCGNERYFAIYIATVRTRHVLQQAAGEWQHTSSDPRELEVGLPLLAVCETCAQPLGAPPAAML